ncbi:hypothetical protein [Flavobacterium sp.]|jgi:hypothetical protein|uniref:hypothetical protein n=1 Tax=Flavobacterium sp. TaxID=239 RepID=UPI002A8068CD|nr:hypothetical protein [Flavobacterium sp.]
MKKIVLLFLFSITLLSCTEKEKTYEELEAEVLCDVLPSIVGEITIQLPPPPFPDSLKSNNFKTTTDKETINLIKKSKEDILKLANEKHKYRIGIIDTLRSIDFTYYKKRYTNKFKGFSQIYDSINERRVEKFEMKKSTLLINIYNIKYLSSLTSNQNHQENTILSLSRVIINENKNLAFFNLSNGGCVPYEFKIISEKKNNKWVVKEIIKE